MKNSWIWILAVLMIAGGIALALWAHPKNTPVIGSDKFQGEAPAPDSQLPPAILTRNAPVVTGFIGDLLVKGNLENDGKTLQPFVAGDLIKLEADAHNAVEYRWSVNGAPLLEKGQEWSARPDREFEFVTPGQFNFAVQVRGAEKNLVSQLKSTQLDVPALKILSVAKNYFLFDEDERFITGAEISIDVDMVQPITADPDFYSFRYFVNDEPIKYPDEDEEWTHNDSLTYTLPAPGNYTFKVEVRRSTEKQAEAHMELPETIVVADAVLLNFDSYPDNTKGAPIGAQVSFSAFQTSRYGKSECRFGIKKINAADYAWLEEDTGVLWGDSSRTWVPTEPGTYLCRCEVRELGKEFADDSREIYFTVTDGNF